MFAITHPRMLKVKVNFKSSPDLRENGIGGKMKIRELAERTGLSASAIRYYERMSLLPPPHRTGGQRRYAAEAIHRVLLIRFAGDMGFTLAEIKIFLSGLRASTPVGPRWRKLAARKITEAERSIERSLRLKSLFQHLLRCRCASLQVCVQRLSLSENLKIISDDRD
jgi:MerR family transcriptional regulator, redox-sensitive transcriptional activator SoxR